MADHQKMDKYNGGLFGVPQYAGLEYDWEVPDNLIVASPGGTSTTHHHPTKGFYGRGSGTSSDIYAGQGDRYIDGVYGNLYRSGHQASQTLGVFPPAPTSMAYRTSGTKQYWQTHTPPPPQSTDREIVDTFEFIKQSDGGREGYDNTAPLANLKKTYKVNFNPLAIFLVFLAVYITFEFWGTAGKLFLQEKVHKGQPFTWWSALIYAIVLSGILLAILHVFNISFVHFEKI